MLGIRTDMEYGFFSTKRIVLFCLIVFIGLLVLVFHFGVVYQGKERGIILGAPYSSTADVLAQSYEVGRAISGRASKPSRKRGNPLCAVRLETKETVVAKCRWDMKIGSTVEIHKSQKLKNYLFGQEVFQYVVARY